MSGWYLIGKEDLLARNIPPEALLYIVGVNDDYEFNENQTEWGLLDDFIILPEKELTNCTFTDGILDADDVQWIAAAAGADPGDNLNLLGVVVYFRLDDVGTLLAFIDRAVVGLPQTLKGVNVTARFDARGILKL